MLIKGKVPEEYADLLLSRITSRNNAEAVRDAAKEYLVNGGQQIEVAEKYGIKQSSLSRLLNKLKGLDDWVAEAIQYHRE